MDAIDKAIHRQIEKGQPLWMLKYLLELISRPDDRQTPARAPVPDCCRTVRDGEKFVSVAAHERSIRWQGRNAVLSHCGEVGR